MRSSTIVLLASSLILMEGYVCVAMFLPIYFLGVILAFATASLWHAYGPNSVNAHILPLVVVALSLEGVTDATTFNRFNQVVHTQIVEADIGAIKQRLMRPAEPTGRRHWMLSIFPMPQSIGSVAIEQGTVRSYEFVYHRWFATNTHRGDLRVTFAEVGDNRIRTTIEDTSYIASYMKLHGTELLLEPLDAGQTRVTLTVAFDRMIDPVWYFQPLERFAVRKGAEYFVQALLVKGV